VTSQVPRRSLTTGADGPRWLSFATGGLLLLGTLFALSAARAILVPLVVAVLLALVLQPPVRGLRRLGIPPGLGAGLIMILLLSFTGYAFYRLAEPARTLVSSAPDTVRQVEQKVRALRQPIQDVSEAAERLGDLATVAPEDQAPIIIKQQTLSDTILSQTGSLVIGIFMTFVLLFFLLSRGDRLLRKVMRMLRRYGINTANVLRSIESKLSGYLAMVALINSLFGAAIGTAMYLLGMPNPLLWAVLAALLSFVPYLGSVVGVGAVAMVGIVTFDDPTRALLPAAVYLSLDFLEANLFTPFVVGRRLALNPIAVLASVILWSWLWGPIGALLAVPLLVTGKIICDEIPALRPIADLISD
jgi:predicted PurR-regulated permease PerM